MIFQHCTLIHQVQHCALILFEFVASLLLVTNNTTTTSLDKERNDDMAPDIARNTDASDTRNIIVKMDDIRNIIVKMDDSKTNIQQFVYMHLIYMGRII